MKLATLCLASICLIALAGCGKPDPKVVRLESRVSELESNVSVLSAREERRWNNQKDLAADHAAIIDVISNNFALTEKDDQMLQLHEIQIGFLETSVSNLVSQPHGAARPAQNYYRPAQPGVMPAATAAQIRAAAESKWPNQYDMQVYEIKEQTEAWHQLHQ